MKIGKLLTSCAVALTLTTSLAPLAHAAAFMKFDGIDGEVTTSPYEDYTRIDGFKVEINGAQGGTELGEMSVNFKIDKASPRLMLACASAITIPQVEIILTRPHQSGSDKAYYTITLTNVVVSSYKNERVSGNETPFDHVTLNYEEITWTYKVLNADGSLDEEVTTGVIAS